MEKISYEQIIGFLSKHTLVGLMFLRQYSPLLAFVNQLRLNGRISKRKLCSVVSCLIKEPLQNEYHKVKTRY